LAFTSASICSGLIGRLVVQDAVAYLWSRYHGMLWVCCRLSIFVWTCLATYCCQSCGN